MKTKKIKIKRFQSLVAIFIVLLMLFVPLSVLADGDGDEEPEALYEASATFEQDLVDSDDTDSDEVDTTFTIKFNTVEEENGEPEEENGEPEEENGEPEEENGEPEEVNGGDVPPPNAIGGVMIDPLFDGDFIIEGAKTTDSVDTFGDGYGYWWWSTNLTDWSDEFGDDSKINDGESLWLKADDEEAYVYGDRWLEVTLKYLGVLKSVKNEDGDPDVYGFGSDADDAEGKPLKFEVMAWTVHDHSQWYGTDFDGNPYPINLSTPNPGFGGGWKEIKTAEVKTGETSVETVFDADLTDTGTSGFSGPYGGSEHTFHKQYGSAIDGNKVDQGHGSGSKTVIDLTSYVPYGWDGTDFTSIGTEASNRLSEEDETVIEWSIVDGKLNWTVKSGGAVYEVFVKGGNDGARIYYYENGAASGTGLTTHTGQGISNVGFITGPRKTGTVIVGGTEEFSTYSSGVILADGMLLAGGPEDENDDEEEEKKDEKEEEKKKDDTLCCHEDGSAQLQSLTVAPERPLTALPATGGSILPMLVLSFLLAGSGAVAIRKFKER